MNKRYTFQLSTIFLCILLVAGTATIVGLWSQNRRLQEELDFVRTDFGIGGSDRPELLVLRRLPSLQRDKFWTWRLKDSARIRSAYYSTKLSPKSGEPIERNSFGISPMPSNGKPYLMSISVELDTSGKWEIVLSTFDGSRGSKTELSSPPSWLGKDSAQFQIELADGYSPVEPFEKGKEVLVRILNTTVDVNSNDGLIVWLE